MFRATLGSAQFPGQWGVAQGLSGQGMNLNTHFHLVPKLRMIGALPLLALYAFRELTGRTSLFYLSCVKVLQQCERPLQAILNDPSLH
jgi:hypothetical protein